MHVKACLSIRISRKGLLSKSRCSLLVILCPQWLIMLNRFCRLENRGVNFRRAHRFYMGCTMATVHAKRFHSARDTCMFVSEHALIRAGRRFCCTCSLRKPKFSTWDAPCGMPSTLASSRKSAVVVALAALFPATLSIIYHLDLGLLPDTSLLNGARL